MEGHKAFQSLPFPWNTPLGKKTKQNRGANKLLSGTALFSWQNLIYKRLPVISGLEHMPCHSFFLFVSRYLLQQNIIIEGRRE